VDLFKSDLLQDSVGSVTTFSIGFACPNRLDLKYPQTAVCGIFASASKAYRTLLNPICDEHIRVALLCRISIGREDQLLSILCKHRKAVEGLIKGKPFQI
jgi:hypothetical protein